MVQSNRKLKFKETYQGISQMTQFATFFENERLRLLEGEIRIVLSAFESSTGRQNQLAFMYNVAILTFALRTHISALVVIDLPP